MNYVILSEKKWNNTIHTNMQKKHGGEWHLIADSNDFNVANLKAINPDKIFVPHWSKIIPREIYETFECVVFHMTDLPYGRGGSPLQNLIVRGHDQTKVTALKVCQEVDAGDIYLKEELSLNGTAEEILMRASGVVENMIDKIIEEKISPVPQQGTPTVFKRRKPEQGSIESLDSITEVYDYIRMLDAEGYPNAFIELNNFRLEFSRASLKADETIFADVRIIKK